MKHAEFIELERVANRAINAAKTFATGTDAKHLTELSSLVAELRHASDTLSDATATGDARNEAAERLLWIFK